MPVDKAQCIRQVGLFAYPKAEYRFDSGKFDKKRLKDALSESAPKLVALLNRITTLDEDDKNTHGRLFKHVIYTDVKGANGAKLVAAALIAGGFKSAYDGNFKLRTGANTFALLTGSAVFGKPIGAKFKKELMYLYNSRPENVEGQKIRILVLDQGYKEGLDVFDVKYMHILDPLVTNADETQVIGRGTRLCGQAGIPFADGRGWPLHVLKYDVVLPSYDHDSYNSTKYTGGEASLRRSTSTKHSKNDNTVSLFDMYLRQLNINMSHLMLASELEAHCIEGAADYELTRNIHSFQIEGIKPKVLRTIIVNVAAGGHVQQTMAAADEEPYRKFLRSTTVVPLPVLVGAWVHVHPKDQNVYYHRRPRTLLGRALLTDDKYARTAAKFWHDPTGFAWKYGMDIIQTIQWSKWLEPSMKHMYDTVMYIDAFITLAQQGQGSNDDSEQQNAFLPRPPPHKLGFQEMRQFVLQNFSEMVWPMVHIENGCKPKQSIEKEDKALDKIVKFTPSQDFVRHFFRPSSPYKGMLIWSGVGTGKTCLAISTATSSFEREGYTVLWVTRHTLKDDVWKNFFDSVCSLVIQDRIRREGLSIPKARAEQMRLLSNSWLRPISYKQFANMLQGRNSIYKDLRKRNGSDDILRKTLVIIDEAHKLFVSDMKPQERPDINVLDKMIHQSYVRSGSDSVRLLLMTGTPITDDVMSIIKLLNFLRENGDRFPEKPEDFISRYCDSKGMFTPEGSNVFLHEITGYISYLNRERDVRQFAYPVLENVVVAGTRATREAQLQRIEGHMERSQMEMEKECGGKKGKAKKECEAPFKDEMKGLKAELRAIKKEEDLSVEAALGECFAKSSKKRKGSEE